MGRSGRLDGQAGPVPLGVAVVQSHGLVAAQAQRQRVAREAERLGKEVDRIAREREKADREHAAADKERDKREEAMRQQIEALRSIERGILEREERLRRRPR